jgi:protein-S-isoprenylcysteine O-methyltransferase Ste14
LARALDTRQPEGLREYIYRHRVLVGNIIAFLGFLIIWIDPYAGVTMPRLITGSLIGLVGFWIRIWASSYQWPNIARDLPDARTGLITAGPYAYMRHPIYVGLLLFTTGAFVGFGSWLAAVFVFVPTLILNLWQARYEESFLVQMHGEEAIRYQKHLPLMLPKVWDPYPDRRGHFSLAQGIKYDIGPLSSFVCFVVVMLIITSKEIPTLSLTLVVLVGSVLFSFFLTWLVRFIFKQEFAG